MATYGKLEEFRPGEEEFSAYFEHVELYFAANGVTEDKKVPIFLKSIWSTTYGLLHSLTAPDKPKDKSLDDLTAKLKAHFEPKHLVITERFHFHKQNQNGSESVSEYLAELRRMAVRCSFGNYLKEVLRDRLVCGLGSEATQKKLLSEADLTLARAVGIARSMEAAAQSTHSLKYGSDLAVGFVESQRGSSATEGQRCDQYGKPDHTAMQCSFKGATCHNCGKKGHLARVCRGSEKPSEGPGISRWANVVENQTAEVEEFHSMDSISYTLHYLSHKAPLPYKAVVQINQQPVEMEIDTGAVVSIISRQNWCGLLPRKSLSKASVTLRTYTAQAIALAGQVDVEVHYRRYKGILKLYVVEGNGPTLLG